MKKNLLATSALIAAGVLVSQGAAAENKPIEITVGGYYEQWVGFVFQDSNQPGAAFNEDNLDVMEDGEIHFQGRTTLDSGLTFGIDVQLEAATSSDQIDESYLFMRGDFGEIVLGSENGAAYAMHYGIDMDQGYGLEEGDTGYYWMVGGTSPTLHNTRNAQVFDNDSNKIRWISPRIAGFQVGVSYAPEARQDSDGPLATEAKNVGVGEGIWAGAINYDNKFGEFRVRASGVYSYVSDPNYSNNTNDPEPWQTAFGLRIGLGGFDGGVAYNYINDGGPINADEVQTIGAGLAYTTGPWGVSLTGVYGWTDAYGSGKNAEQLVVQLGGQYALGPGVQARATLAYGESDDLIAPGQDYNGYAMVGGITLQF